MGIIPARAGFTQVGDVILSESADHPRSRGVYRGRKGDRGDVGGSSPLARGLLDMTSEDREIFRIIPARAGFTHQQNKQFPAAADHPRSRGVYSSQFHTVNRQEGSSPLARGLLSLNARPSGSWGIIPARAGFTKHTMVFGRFSTDHPRSRGVYAALLASLITMGGSSPLARGLRSERGG